MKKIIKLIAIIIIIISFIIVLLPNKSYGICNTVRFTKEVSAVKLTLSDGKTLYDLRVSKQVSNQTRLTSTNYKNLKLVFVVETGNGTEDKVKSSLKSFVNKIYELYGSSESKINMGIVPFEDLSQGEISNRSTNIDTNENILKNSKSEIVSEIDNLKKDNKRTLQEALLTAQNNLSEYSFNNEQILQYIIFVTDGIENGDVNVNINGIDENIIEVSNLILKDLSNNEMVAMYGLLISTSKTKDENLEKLFEGVLEMTVAEDISINNLTYQLQNNAYEYISQFVIRESTLVPSGGNTNTLFTPDAIILTVDEEIVHGATLEIEYVMSVSRYAAYGNGEIYSSKFMDTKDDKLVFDKNARLLTDPSSTNADYGWEMTNEGLVTETGGQATKLILSVVLTPQVLGDARFSNSASCATSFNVGTGSTASYTLRDKAIDVAVLPPFGEDKNEDNMDTLQTTIIIVSAIVALTGFGIMVRASIKNRKNTKHN